MLAVINQGPTAPDIEPGEQVHQMTIDEYELHFRLPNSLDLVAIVGYQDAVLARHHLLQRCIVRASKGGEEIVAEDLPENVVAAVTTQMDELDPQAELRLDLNCGVCGHHWQVLFDIVSFLWKEISISAKSLLSEVHTLALVYGWSEADILSLSTVRRQFYLEMVTNG